MHSSALESLSRDPWLLTLPTSVRLELIAATTIKRFQADYVLYRKGDCDGHFYGVLSGRIRAGATSYAGSETMLTSVLPGDWFGEISILDGLGRTHDAVTVEESELAIIPKRAISKLCQQNAFVKNALVELLCNHCRQAFSAIDEFILFNPEQRLATRLLRIDQSLTSSSAIKINQQELSNQVGISRQSINKTLKKWERQGWVKLAYRSISVTNTNQLLNLVTDKSG